MRKSTAVENEIEQAMEEGVTPIFLIGLIEMARGDQKLSEQARELIHNINRAGTRFYIRRQNKAKRTLDMSSLNARFKRIIALLIVATGVAFMAPRGAQAQTAGTETINVIDTGCVTGNTCTLQLSREALAAGVTTCDPAGNAKYSALNTAAVVPAVGLVNTSWTYADTALTQGVSYCYVATVTSSAGTVSAASTPFLAAIPAPPPPPAPTVTGSYAPGV
jgi:hypothetical protein